MSLVTNNCQSGIISTRITLNVKYGYNSQARMNYIHDSSDIYRRSFDIIKSEVNLDHLRPDLVVLVMRLIHACGMTDIVDDISAHENLVAVGREALAAGKPILCDTQMVAAGISRTKLHAKNPIICTLNEPEVKDIAKQIGNTRTAAALSLWIPHIEGAVVAIGNAPTAMFRLLEMLDQGMPKPSIILGFPVGFVGAANSKAALAASTHNIPFITLHGRRGGSAITVAAINALAKGEDI